MRETQLKSPAPTYEQDPLAPELISEERDHNGWVQHLRVPDELPCWPGHFPERAILPGVVQLSWAVAAVQRWMQSTTPPTLIEALKFKTPVLPGQPLTLTVRKGSAVGSFVFEFRNADSIHSKGRLIFSELGKRDP